MVVCPKCGSQQPDGASFCDQCGAPLGGVASPVALPTAATAVCPSCGAPVVPGEAFCDSCGAALGTGVPVPPAAPAPSPAVRAPAPAPAGSLVCPNCGAQLEPGSSFCDMCGAPVSTAEPPAPQPPVPSPIPAPPVQPPPPPPPPPGPVISGRLVVQATNATLPFPPGKTEILIGREDPVSNVFPDIDLTDHGGDEGGVSRRHARIILQGNQVLIEDLNSTNHTYVNQQKLTPGQPHPLNNGDEIRLGRVKLNFYTS